MGYVVKKFITREKGKAVTFSILPQHENGPSRPPKCYTITECRREVSFAVAFFVLPSDVLFPIQEADNALLTSTGLRVFMHGGDHLAAPRKWAGSTASESSDGLLPLHRPIRSQDQPAPCFVKYPVRTQKANNTLILRLASARTRNERYNENLITQHWAAGRRRVRAVLKP
ncbi:hypothetical protein EVAR_40269_1 [Eumeta japonica]|uniref:Uncharacterized protein n=1 Tax=Eumeta variegata TaxID=151549 RepID=A0A4C1WVC7_EUMVA|nr:hypothetical protein EVAR_40269_1 [Eumeta japonica]